MPEALRESGVTRDLVPLHRRRWIKEAGKEQRVVILW